MPKYVKHFNDATLRYEYLQEPEPSPMMTVEETAKRLGVNEQAIREWIKAEKVPWGIATNPTGKKWNYDIFRERLEIWIAGKDLQA